MGRLSLGARLAIAFALLAAVTAFVTASVASASTDRQVRDDVDQFLRERAGDIVEGRRERPERRNGDNDRNRNTNSTAGLTANSVSRAVEDDAVVQVLDGNGDRVWTIGPTLPVDAADLAMAQRFDPEVLRTVTVNGEQYRMITVHIAGGGAVQVAQSLDTTNILLGDIRRELLWLGLGLSAVAGLVGWLIASSTTRPLRKLTRSVESIRQTQDLSQSVSLDRSDELGRLSSSFDDLLGSLSESRDQQHRLVQDAAHELRTPLTSVRANIDFLERASDLDAESRQSTLRSVKAELSELSDLLAEVVELATESRDSAAFEEIDLVTVVEAALAQFELRSARPVERDMATSVVMADSSMLTRAVANLVANADKYTTDEQSPVEVRVADGVVTVSDRGPGVQAGEHSQMFERFWRSDEARSATGSGLGLAIVKKAVDEHGGSVFARNRAGGGLEIGFRIAEVGGN